MKTLMLADATLRDYFAIEILAKNLHHYNSLIFATKDAYRVADLMLVVREQDLEAREVSVPLKDENGEEK